MHAAGVTRDKSFIRKTGVELAEVLAPKVAGLVALDAATRDCDLDFIAALFVGFRCSRQCGAGRLRSGECVHGRIR